jgi:hypothetical protein
VRASSQQYPKAHLAAISFAGFVLGYACSRHFKSPGGDSRRYFGHDLSANDVSEFFDATRHSWGLSASKSLASRLVGDCIDDIEPVTR